MLNAMKINYLSGTHQIKEALILFKFLLIHLSLSTSSIIKLISPVPKQFIITTLIQVLIL